MNLVKTILSRKIKPQVIHKSLGRMRIQITALKSVPENVHRHTEEFLNRFNYPNGIKSIEITFITGNLLIVYDVSKISEESVLLWINNLTQLLSEIAFHLMRLPESKRTKVSGQLFKYINELTEKGEVLNERIAIPKNVWT